LNTIFTAQVNSVTLIYIWVLFKIALNKQDLW